MLRAHDPTVKAAAAAEHRRLPVRAGARRTVRVVGGPATPRRRPQRALGLRCPTSAAATASTNCDRVTSRSDRVDPAGRSDLDEWWEITSAFFRRASGIRRRSPATATVASAGTTSPIAPANAPQAAESRRPAGAVAAVRPRRTAVTTSAVLWREAVDLTGEEGEVTALLGTGGSLGDRRGEPEVRVAADLAARARWRGRSARRWRRARAGARHVRGTAWSSIVTSSTSAAEGCSGSSATGSTVRPGFGGPSRGPDGDPGG